MTTPIPDEAVEAGADHLRAERYGPMMSVGEASTIARIVLAAAAPHVRAVERARIIAALTDPERYAAWHKAEWDAGRRDHVVAGPSVLAGVAAYVWDQLEMDEETDRG